MTAADPKKIQWRGETSIQQVLAALRDDASRVVWLAFVRSSGPQVGSVKVVSRAMYGRSKEPGKAPKPGQTRTRALHIEKGTLPMTDADTGAYFTPLISHIIGFNLLKVKH